MTALIDAYQTAAPVRLFAMAATLLALTMAPCLAQSQSSQEQMHPALAAAPDAGSSLVTDGRSSAGHDESAQAHTPTGDNGLTENAYDFTDPDRIPGFASKPYHTPSWLDDSD